MKLLESRGTLPRVAVLGTAILSLSAVQLHAAGTPGAGNGVRRRPDIGIKSIAPLVQETGAVSLSLDALGTNNSAGGTIQVQKPAGATVRRAFLLSATAGLSGRTLDNDDVTLDGAPITWDATSPSAIGSHNYIAEVTNLVSSKINAAPAGTIDFAITESDTGGIDGEILAVIFNDPNVPANNTVALMFGAQNTTGDRFAVGLAEPINKNNPNLRIEMSLGISFGFQPSGQFSRIDVNGQRLTSSAGGQDDGEGANGALITVGGIGDSPTNPADPNGGDTDPRVDDELYDLLPFVQNGDRSIVVDTVNPSNDDNVFFAALTFRAAAAVVGEGVVLSPLVATVAPNTAHTVTATVQDEQGNPIVGRTVTFTVKSGPNQGQTGTDVTDAQGRARFTYTSTAEGTDVIQASFVGADNQTNLSNEVRVTFDQDGGGGDGENPTCRLTGTNPTGVGEIEFTIQDASGLASIRSAEGNATVQVPSFEAGTTEPVVVTVRRGNDLEVSRVTLVIRDQSGNETRCRAAFTLLQPTPNRLDRVSFTRVQATQYYLTLHAARPFVKARVNAPRGGSRSVDLRDNQVETLDLSRRFRDSNSNRVSVSTETVEGKKVKVLAVLSDEQPE